MRHALPLLLFANLAQADPPDIVAVQAMQAGNGWRFDVTVRHPDTGWDHYADGWRVESAEGTVLGLRVLAHPHEAEQPFTRSLGGVAIPEGTASVVVRARCLTDGWAEVATEVPLAQ